MSRYAPIRPGRGVPPRVDAQKHYFDLFYGSRQVLAGFGVFACQILLALIERHAAALRGNSYCAIIELSGADGLRLGHIGRDSRALVSPGSSIPIDRSVFMDPCPACVIRALVLLRLSYRLF